jgi:hypothetical protein
MKLNQSHNQLTQLIIMSLSPLNATYVRVKFAGDSVEREMSIADFVAVLEANGVGSGTTESILAKIGDGERIGAEYLPEVSVVTDENGNIPATGIKLTGSGNVALDDNVFGINSRGEVILHNGVDDGNYIPYLQPFRKARGFAQVTAAQNQAGHRVKLASFFFPASEMVAGTRYQVAGSVVFQFATATNTPPFQFGFCPEESSAAGNTVGYLNGTVNANLIFPNFQLWLQLDADAPGNYVLGPYNDNCGLILSAGNSGSPSIIPVNAPLSAFTEIGSLDTNQEWGMYYDAPATASAPKCEIYYDLEITKLA